MSSRFFYAVGDGTWDFGDPADFTPRNGYFSGTVSAGAGIFTGTVKGGAFQVDASSGAGRALVGRRATTGGIVLRGYEDTQAFVDLDPMPGDGTSDATIRMFRSTNTGGNIDFNIYKGDGTSALQTRLRGKATSFINALAGNVLIGKTTDDGTNKLQVAGNVMSDGVFVAGNADPYPVLQPRNTNFVSHSTGAQAGYSATRWSNDGVGPQIIMAKSRGATVGANGLVSVNDDLGYLTWTGNDGTDNATVGAQILVEVDGTPGVNAMPGRMLFQTGNTSGGLTTVLTLSADNSAVFASTVGATRFLATNLIGYDTGAGGVVTQLTSKSTGVTLNAACGRINTHNQALAAGASATFTFTNSFISAADAVIVHRGAGGTDNTYEVSIDSVTTGACVIRIKNDSATSRSEVLNLNFSVINGQTS